MIDKEMTTIKSKDKTNAKTTKTKRTWIKNSSIRKDDILKFIFGVENLCELIKINKNEKNENFIKLI